MRVWIAALAVLLGCATRDPVALAPPDPGSPLARVERGMGLKEVESILGPATDQRAGITGKLFIPFYFGPGRVRIVNFYKGVGRVVFNGAAGVSTDMYVDHVEPDSREPGFQRGAPE